MKKITAFLDKEDFIVIRSDGKFFKEITSPITGEVISIPVSPRLFGVKFIWDKSEAQHLYDNWVATVSRKIIPQNVWEYALTGALSQFIKHFPWHAVFNGTLFSALAYWRSSNFDGEIFGDAIVSIAAETKKITPDVVERAIVSVDPLESSSEVAAYRQYVAEVMKEWEYIQSQKITFDFNSMTVEVIYPKRLEKKLFLPHSEISKLEEASDIRFILHSITTLKEWRDAGKTPHIGPFDGEGVRLSLFGREENPPFAGVKSYLGLTFEQSNVNLRQHDENGEEIDWSKDQDFGWKDDFGQHVEFWDNKSRRYVRSSMSGLTKYTIIFDDAGNAIEYNIPLSVQIERDFGVKYGINIIKS